MSMLKRTGGQLVNGRAANETALPRSKPAMDALARWHPWAPFWNDGSGRSSGPVSRGTATGERRPPPSSFWKVSTGGALSEWPAEADPCRAC